MLIIIEIQNIYSLYEWKINSEGISKQNIIHNVILTFTETKCLQYIYIYIIITKFTNNVHCNP